MTSPQAGVDASLYQALVESCADVFALMAADGTFRYVSASVERVLGYTPQERLGDSGMALVHEDDRSLVSESFAAVLASPGVPFRYTCRVRHKDGSWRHIQSTVVNRLDSPLGGIVINYCDLTREKLAEGALKKSDERYRSLIHGALYAIYRTSVAGEVLDANPAFARMLGYESVAELAGLNMRDVYARPEDRERVIEEARAASKEVVSTTLDWRRRDGAPIVVRITSRLVRPDDGSTPSFESIAEDITERRARDEQMRQSQKMEAVGQLARGIAHDFNNVLAAILGNADLLQLQVGHDEGAAADLAEITKAAERGAALTRQLLAFSRSRSGSPPEVLDFHDVVRGFDSMLRRLSGDIELKLDTPGPSPRVRIEPGQIEQVVMNLVLNAREATGEGGLIEVSADALTLDSSMAARFPGLEPGRYARLVVRDNGKGISPANQDRVFDPYFSTKDPAKGAGLGLSIVYGIAKDAGGAIAFATGPNQGTTFEVLLPAL